MSIAKCSTQLLKSTAKSAAALKALIFASVFAAGAMAQTDSATVVFVVNDQANIELGCTGVTVTTQPSANSGTQRATVKMAYDTYASVSYRGAQGLNAPVMTNSNGKVTLNLPAQSYQSAEISLHSVNGKRIMNGKADGSGAVKSISRQNVASGVYLLSVKGTNGSAFTTRLTHRGGKLSVNAAIGAVSMLSKSAAVGDSCTIKVGGAGAGYVDTTFKYTPTKANDTVRITLRPEAVVNPPNTGEPPNIEKKDFKEKVGNVEFDMIYIPGGPFTLGCESNCAPGAVKTVSATVSNYFIMKTEVTTALWNVVMGKSGGSTSSSYASATWYDAMDFACKLGKLTGHNYRIMTEAEFEYAAKKYKDKLLKIGDGSSITGEEWAYNSWDVDKHMGGVDPVGPSSGEHTQKTRRDANGTGESNVTSRLIRSIEGTGPSTRLVFSADAAYPPNYVPSCDIHAPELGAEPVNSYRDPRWVTGDSFRWEAGAIAIGSISLSVWDDGTAKLGSANGQWFTSNNFTFVFVPSSGSITKYAYIFLDDKEGSLISEKSFMSGGYVGRIAKKAANVAKPAVSGLKSGEELAKAQTNFATEFAMVDMENIPAAKKLQDPRLLDGGANYGWFQDNTSMSAAHHYRKDIDPDEFRFTVNQGNGRTVLAAGEWFTVNNTFLRVTHKNGYVADYLYTIADKTFYHNSFIGYERADFRMFEKISHSNWPTTSCGNICSQEIPKGLTPVAQTGYLSTYTPPKCPSGGCK